MNSCSYEKRINTLWPCFLENEERRKEKEERIRKKKRKIMWVEMRGIPTIKSLLVPMKK